MTTRELGSLLGRSLYLELSLAVHLGCPQGGKHTSSPQPSWEAEAKGGPGGHWAMCLGCWKHLPEDRQSLIKDRTQLWHKVGRPGWGNRDSSGE